MKGQRLQKMKNLLRPDASCFSRDVFLFRRGFYGKLLLYLQAKINDERTIASNWNCLGWTCHVPRQVKQKLVVVVNKIVTQESVTSFPAGSEVKLAQSQIVCAGAQRFGGLLNCCPLNVSPVNKSDSGTKVIWLIISDMERKWFAFKRMQITVPGFDTRRQHAEVQQWPIQILYDFRHHTIQHANTCAFEKASICSTELSVSSKLNKVYTRYQNKILQQNTDARRNPLRG